MAKHLRINPNLVVGDSEFNDIAKFNSVSKPSYFEYELLPALWIDTAQIIEREMNIALAEKGKNGK